MEAWNQFLSQLEQELGPEVVEKWIRPLKILRFDAGNLYLEARDAIQIDWFEEHIRPRTKGFFFNNNQRPIKIHLSFPEQRPTKPKEKEFKSTFSIVPDTLDPDMSLETFIPKANLIAYKLLSDLANGTPFNPIYLYGPKGAGKTHLLMGAAALLQAKRKKVFYVRGQNFTEHVVQAIRLGMMQEFRKKYREIDALFVDDIHIFSKKNATQEEFFHTFNTLHTLGKPILLSSLIPPMQLKEIEPRLVSRFEWGITLPLVQEDKRAIFEKKMALWKITLPEESISYILSHFPKDPLLALQAIAFRLAGKNPLTPASIEQSLADLLEQEQKKVLTSDEILKVIASHYGLKIEDLLGKSQTREHAVPRQVAMYLCREKLKLSFQKIGELFNRDHSTVMSSVKQIEKAAQQGKSDILEIIGSTELIPKYLG